MGYQYRGTVRDLDEPITEAHKDKPQAKPAPVFDPTKCGRYVGYKQHRQFGQDACGPCKASLAKYSRDYRARIRSGQSVVMKAFSPDACGTYAGYARHKRYELKPCAACLVAYADYMHAYRAKRRAK